jgi:pyruvate dehydrogenase (quinone)
MFAKACGAAGYTVEDPRQVRDVLREAFSHPGPALVEAIVDPNEAPMPGKITMKQALHFAEAMARGQKDRWGIIKTVIEDKVRETV